MVYVLLHQFHVYFLNPDDIIAHQLCCWGGGQGAHIVHVHLCHGHCSAGGASVLCVLGEGGEPMTIFPCPFLLHGGASVPCLGGDITATPAGVFVLIPFPRYTAYPPAAAQNDRH